MTSLGEAPACAGASTLSLFTATAIGTAIGGLTVLAVTSSEERTRSRQMRLRRANPRGGNGALWGGLLLLGAVAGAAVASGRSKA